MEKLKDKTALITGGNSGIGFATAKLFLEHGAKVILTGRNPEAVADAMQALGSQVHGIVSDARNMQDVRSLPDQVRAISPKVDIVFVNAGVGLFAPFSATTEEVFDANMDINFKGAYFTLQGMLPLIPDHGAIILNGTILVHCGLATASAYAASKGAVISLSKTLAIELADRNIRVNCISPGPISTPIYEKMGMPADVLQQFASGVLAKVPLQRFGEPEDVAAVALFLASNDSPFLTGAEIRIDGGKSLTF